jgi:hypothetical protein
MFILRFDKIHYLLSLFVLTNIILFGQNTDAKIEYRSLNEKEWSASRKGIDYHQKQKRAFYQSETKKIGYEDQLEKPSVNREKKQTDTSPDFSAWGNSLQNAGKVFLVIIGILLVYLFAKNTNFSRDKKVEDFSKILSEVEDNLPEADIETPLERAIKERNYKIATRLYYLLIIQKLAEKKEIVWSKEKTNREYTNELRRFFALADFRQVTLIYEKAWFGKELTTQDEFERFQPLFDSLIQKTSMTT